MRRKLVALMVPIVMLAVATSHWIRVDTQNQSPWVGGAFSMFATVDGPYRVIEFETANGNIRFPTSGNDDLRRAASLPTPNELHRLHLTLREQGLDPVSLRVLRPTFRRGHLDWQEVGSYVP